MVNKIFKLVIVLSVLILTSCDHNPLDKLFDPIGDGALGGEWGYWKIYDDQLNTRGGVMLSPTDEHQTFAEVAGNPRSGTKCIKYSWDGTRLWSEKDGKLVNWTAAILIVAPTWQEYEEEEKDLSPGGYNKITFWIRGNLSPGAKVRFEGPGPRGSCDSTGDLTAIPSSWTSQQIDLTSTDLLLQAKEFFKIVFIGGGGTVYVDDIIYSK